MLNLIYWHTDVDTLARRHRPMHWVSRALARWHRYTAVLKLAHWHTDISVHRHSTTWAHTVFHRSFPRWLTTQTHVSSGHRHSNRHSCRARREDSFRWLRQQGGFCKVVSALRWNVRFIKCGFYLMPAVETVAQNSYALVVFGSTWWYNSASASRPLCQYVHTVLVWASGPED